MHDIFFLISSSKDIFLDTFDQISEEAKCVVFVIFNVKLSLPISLTRLKNNSIVSNFYRYLALISVTYAIAMFVFFFIVSLLRIEGALNSVAKILNMHKISDK